MAIPWPDRAPSKWDTVVLGGVALPGIGTVAVKLSNELDVKKPKGGAGASVTAQGPEAATVTITLAFHSAEHLAEWQDAVKVLRPKKDVVSAKKIVHPKTQIYSIDAVLVQTIDDEDNKRGDTYTVKIHCVEFTGTPKGAQTKTEKRLDPREQILAETITNLPKPSAGNTGP